MASIISAGTTSGTALNMTGDTSGVLQLATNGSTTAVTIDTSQRVIINGATAVTGTPLIIGSTTGNVGIALQPTNGTGVYAYWTTDATNGYLSSSSGATGRKFTYSLSAPDNAVTIDSSGNLLFNSGYGSAATAYGCRAWVNFNGTGTPAIRASGNVSSITDNGTGNYTVNFTTAMPDTNYAVNFMGSNRVPNLGDAGSSGIVNSPGADFTTSGFKVATKNVEGASSGNAIDLSVVNVTVFR